MVLLNHRLEKGQKTAEAFLALFVGVGYPTCRALARLATLPICRSPLPILVRHTDPHKHHIHLLESIPYLPGPGATRGTPHLPLPSTHPGEEHGLQGALPLGVVLMCLFARIIVGIIRRPMGEWLCTGGADSHQHVPPPPLLTPLPPGRLVVYPRRPNKLLSEFKLFSCLCR
jgi:hypothetical protein